MLDDGSIVVADNYFKKTQENILAGSKGSILFITNDGKAYQVKGKIEYHKEGAIFDDMKSWNPKKHPGHAAAVLRVEDAYSGAEKLS
jgi:predicted pyridoxine 5'-phosphate oxidase superfamily flavin-nucleotide-binding protein